MAIQGYDKTATYSSIATGNVIEAAYFTNEFAEIFTAFAKTSSTSSSGHRHDGGDAMGGYNALLSDSDNDTKISVETISISGGAPSYTDSDTITIVAGSATIATIDSGDIKVAANKGITFGDAAEKIEGDGTDLTISGNNIKLTATADVIIPADVGITFGTGEKIEGNNTDLTVTSGADINLTATADVNIPSGVGVTFGDDGEKIEGDGTDLTISGNNINLTATADVVIPADVGITFGTGEKIEGNSTDLTVTSGADINLTATADVNIPSGVGITFGDDGEKIEGDGTDLTVSASADLNLTATTDINIPANVGLTFGDDGEKIEGDGTDLTISSSALATIDAGTDITLDAGGGDIFFKDDGTTFGSATNTSGDLIIKSGTTTALTFSGANVTGSGTLEATTITASTAFVPDASGGADLGSTSLEFGDLYIADDKKIYLGSNQDFSIEYDEDGNDTTAIVASTGVSLAPHGTSSGNTTPLQFQELAANGAHYIGFKAPDSISANVTWTLPNADGSANQVIKTDGSGALSWSTPSSGAVTAINNATANELVTIGSTTTELDAEGNLTFDGSTLAVTGDATISDDLGLVSDAAVLTFGANSEITVTHVHDTGLNFKHTATADDKPIILTLQTGETDIAANDVIGKVAFQAPDEGTGTDAILVAAAIQARSEGDFSSSANATSIDFMTGASEAAATKWSITSAGSFLNAGTNTIDMNAGELILDADQDTSITADTDDQIDIKIAGADDFRFTANTFTALAGSTITTADLSVVTDDQSAGVLIESSDNTDANHAVGIDLYRSPTGATNDELMSINFSGKDDAGNKHAYFQLVPRIADASSGAEEGWMEFRGTRGGSDGQTMIRLQNNSAGAQTQLQMGTAGTAALPSYTWTDDPDTGMFWVSAGILGWTSQGTEEMRLADQRLFLSDTANTGAAGAALTINQAHNDDEIFALKSSDIAHGITGQTETDTYGTFLKFADTTGGLRVRGFNDGANQGLMLDGAVTASDTSDTTSSYGAISIRGAIKSGTGLTTLGSTANVLNIDAWGSTIALFKGDGTVHAVDTSWATALDTEDDMMALRMLDKAQSTKGIINSAWDSMIGTDWKYLQKIGVAGSTHPEKGRPDMFSIQGVQKLTMGATWYLGQNFMAFLETIEKYMPGIRKEFEDHMLEQSGRPAMLTQATN